MIPVGLESARLVLDQPTAADVPAIVEYCRDPLFEHFMTLPWPYRPADAEYFVGELVPNGWASGMEYTWALRARDAAEAGPGVQASGLMGAIGYRAGGGDIGFWIGKPFRGNGYMGEAVRTVATWLFARGVRSIAWECVVGNAASASVARKTGFQYTGERASALESRDGTRPLAWHGVLGEPARRSDLSVMPAMEWPAESFGETSR